MIWFAVKIGQDGDYRGVLSRGLGLKSQPESTNHTLYYSPAWCVGYWTVMLNVPHLYSFVREVRVRTVQ